MIHSESLKEITPALVSCHAKFHSVKKDSNNPHFGHKYVSLEAFCEFVRPILTENKIVVMQTVLESQPEEIVVETRLIHTSGEWIATPVKIPMEGKRNAHNVGSAITYGRRYGLAAILALTPDEDDDGNAASGPLIKSQPAARQENRSSPPKQNDSKKQDAQPAGSDERIKRYNAAVKKAKEVKLSKEFDSAWRTECKSANVPTNPSRIPVEQFEEIFVAVGSIMRELLPVAGE
jgi:hypothetical protein